jgi:ABC-type nitrate/sulfonate/bicarbonate transport system ATPase subunit
VIEVSNLCFSYGDKSVFDGLSLQFGDVTCVTGPSGCGKTTLLKLLAGLLKPQGGTITGMPGRISFMFQEDRLLPWCTARENVAAVLPPDEADKADGWLKRVELEEYMSGYPANLSGGQRRRVALARALAYGGGVLILDEPYKGFDPELTRRMTALILSQNMPVVASVHSTEEMGLLGGEIIRLAD